MNLKLDNAFKALMWAGTYCPIGHDAAAAKSLQSCLTLCDPMNCSPTASSVHEILQARILEWVAISFSRGSSWPRDRTCISYVSFIGRRVLYHQHHLGSPLLLLLLLLPLSLAIHGGLVPGPPRNTKICRCSSPLYKMVLYLHVTLHILPYISNCL